MKVYRVNFLLGIFVDGNSFNFLGNSYIAKNINIVQDRAISLKFSTLRISKNIVLPIFRNFLLPKNGGHFEFLNCCEKCKNISLLLSP